MSGSSIKILIVDDSESDRLTTRFLLEGQRSIAFEIKELDCGEGVIEVCESYQPDCVLLDFRLPDMDGIEIVSMLRKHFGPYKFGIVLLTASGHEILAVKALKSGAHDYIPKAQLSEDLLLRSIENALEKLALERQNHEAKMALAANERRLRNIVDTAPCALYTADLQLGRSVYISGSLQNLLGFSAEETNELDAERLTSWISTEDLPAVTDHVRRLRAGKEDETHECEFRIRHKDGTWRWLSVNNRVVMCDADGNGQVIAGAASDVSHRKQMEEELKRSNYELERFAYVASHDLQEPLRTILSFSELFARRNHTDDPESNQYLSYVRQGGKRMQALIADLLTFSRVTQAGQEPLEEVDCNEILAQTLNALGALVAETGATIQSGALPLVVGNSYQLSQLFQNLVGNALKYRSDRIPSITITAERTGRWWRFCVGDNGIGFDMTYADRIFEAFKRLHTRDAFSGTGLGLAICKKIVERHGGRIWAESQPGLGSNFFFTLAAN